MRRGWRNLAPVLAAWAAGAGCGPTAPPAQAVVHGTVTFRGYALAGGTVVFAPDTDRGTTGTPMAATIGPDGRYDLADGGRISAGWYRVAIADPPGDYAYGSRFPTALRRPDRSGLSREVRPGMDQVFDFYIDMPE